MYLIVWITLRTESPYIPLVVEVEVVLVVLWRREGRRRQSPELPLLPGEHPLLLGPRHRWVLAHLGVGGRVRVHRAPGHAAVLQQVRVVEYLGWKNQDNVGNWKQT